MPAGFLDVLWSWLLSPLVFGYIAQKAENGFKK